MDSSNSVRGFRMINFIIISSSENLYTSFSMMISFILIFFNCSGSISRDRS
jgi:hypothetical protein